METIEELYIKEEDFASEMEGKVLPFLKDKIKDGYFKNRDGLNLHYQLLINPSEKASIVISHGYCEFTTKYAETMYYFYQMGYSVFAIDHRGHGLSDREVEGYSKVNINHFEDYVLDFNEFIEKVVKEESLTKRLILFAHSMGGGIGALYIEQFPDVFERRAKQERIIGHSCINGVFLDELEPDRGNMNQEVMSDCDISCQLMF
jgi:lysophospholipase